MTTWGEHANSTYIELGERCEEGSPEYKGTKLITVSVWQPLDKPYLTDN